MLTVQPLSINVADEELGTVGIRASISHGKAAGEVLDLKVLVSELWTIDRLTTSAIEVRKVTTLHHEVLDDTVKQRILVAEALLTRAKGSEVLDGLWNILSKKTHDNTLRRLVTDSNVKEDLVSNFWLHGVVEFWLVRL